MGNTCPSPRPAPCGIWPLDCSAVLWHLALWVEYKKLKYTHTHTQLYSPFEKAAQLYVKNESENLSNQKHKTLKRNLAQSTQWRHIMFSEAENFCRNLHFLLLTETDGNGQLNISMQQLATSFDLVLKYWKAKRKGKYECINGIRFNFNFN